ncbi:speckle-type POZ protein-like isoform X1 [Planococcus citri]|uniref:speckle-type POZ protein-like isoform X1 n=1 Tax=Planococcus citri TaxID=170843 RepID=UPI0031F783E8
MSSSNYCSPSVDTFDEIWCNSKIRAHKVNYVWTINNFDFREAEGSSLLSPEFSASSNNEIKWNLKLYPNGKSDSKNTIAIFLYICSAVVQKVFAKYKASVLDFQKQKQCAFSTEILGFALNGDGVSNWDEDEFIPKNDYFKNNLLIDNTLTINVELIFSAVCDSISETSSSPLSRDETLQLYPTLSIPACDLSENFGQLLGQDKLTDIVLSVNGQEFPAHKIILSARSPVFAAMFEHNVKENEENRVYINDMDEEVASEMIRYIYTGKCEKLAELATGLLVAADKYNLSRLKMICADELYKTLSVDNAASILLLADMHSVIELKNGVIKFIVSKLADVMNSEGWKNIKSVELLNEVFSSLAQR